MVSKHRARFEYVCGSQAALTFEIKNQTQVVPITEMPLPTKKMTCWHLRWSSKLARAALSAVVPTAAPALPTAAANPRKCPRKGVGKLSLLTKKLQSPGPSERNDWKSP
jgi:hypothetical protein